MRRGNGIRAYAGGGGARRGGGGGRREGGGLAWSGLEG